MGEQSPYRKIFKKSRPPHIRGGEPVNFHVNNFLGVSWEFRGSRPPLCIYIYFFNYFFYKGIALPNNLVPFVLKSDKNWAIDTISKKKSAPPLFSDIFQFSTNFGGFGLFFGNCVNRSIFIRFQNGRLQIVQKSNPLIEKILKIYIYIYKGGWEPHNFQLTPKKLLIWKLTGSPPLMWGEGIFLDIFL